MSAEPPSDPRVFFAAQRTLLAWQRSSLALMAFGFVIERFSLFLTVLRNEPGHATHHVLSILMGVLLILIGAAVALVSSVSYRRFVGQLPPRDLPTGVWVEMGWAVNGIVAMIGLGLAVYLLLTGV
jgi:putative membrane protein